jgi:hypothetical protein
MRGGTAPGTAVQRGRASPCCRPTTRCKQDLPAVTQPRHTQRRLGGLCRFGLMSAYGIRVCASASASGSGSGPGCGCSLWSPRVQCV